MVQVGSQIEPLNGAGLSFALPLIRAEIIPRESKGARMKGRTCCDLIERQLSQASICRPSLAVAVATIAILGIVALLFLPCRTGFIAGRRRRGIFSSPTLRRRSLLTGLAGRDMTECGMCRSFVS